MTAALSLKGVSHAYREVTVLAGVTFDVSPGTIHCLVGPSGSGKSTLLKIVAGLVMPRAGKVLIHGRDATSIPPHQRDLGFVFQSTQALFPHLTVRGNVEFAFQHGCRRGSKGDWRSGVNSLMEKTGIAELASRRISELSGGQRQRVAIVRSLAYKPSVLLVDEPMSGLDNENRTSLIRLIRELRDDTGVAVLYVTHDEREVLELADVVGVLVAGTLQQSGRTREVFDAPKSEQIARILGLSTAAEVTHAENTR